MTLDDALLRAHARNDVAALVRLYEQAADEADAVNVACFFLTQAYVFALEKGDPAQDRLFARLRAQGRV